MNSDFSDLLQALNEGEVEYLIVGGYAVAKHTEPRYTKDLDIWINNTRENAERVFQALRAFGAPLGSVSVDDFTIPDLVFQIGSRRQNGQALRWFWRGQRSSTRNRYSFSKRSSSTASPPRPCSITRPPANCGKVSCDGYAGGGGSCRQRRNDKPL